MYGKRSNIRAQGSGCRIQDSGIYTGCSSLCACEGFKCKRFQGLGCRVQGSGLRAQGSGLRIQGSAPDVRVFALADVLELHGLEILRRQGYGVVERTCGRTLDLGGRKFHFSTDSL